MSIALLEREIIRQMFADATSGLGQVSGNVYGDLFLSQVVPLDPAVFVPTDRDWRGPTVRFEHFNGEEVVCEHRYYRLVAQEKELP